MKRAFNYVRFSSPPQEWGASERRQDGLAKAYCEKHGLALVEKFIDRGVSGWKGKNRERALGELLKTLKAGDYFLVEDEDRISRENPLKLGNLLFEIAERGVFIVTLTDGKIITKENFFESNIFLPTILKGTLAHLEDQKKPGRILDAWEERRQDIAQGKDRFGKLPFWLKRDKNTGELIRIPAAEKVVQEIFDMSNRGVGVRGVTEHLIKSKVPTFRTAKGKPTRWSQSTVNYVLHSPVVYGAFQSHRRIDGRKLREGELVEGVLPVIVPKEKVLLVQDKISRRKRFAIKGVAKVNNLFSKLAVCAHCGASMVYTHKGKHGYLTCGKFHVSHDCKPGVMNYDVVEKVILGFFGSATDQYKAFPPSHDAPDDEAVATQRASLNEAKRKSQNVAKLLVDFPESEDFRNQYKDLQVQQRTIKHTIDALEAKARLAKNVAAEWGALAVNFTRGTFDRVAVRETFRSIIRSIDFEVQENRFTIHWISEGTPDTVTKIDDKHEFRIGNERLPDTFEVKQTFRGCKPAVWHYRYMVGVWTNFSDWIVIESPKKAILEK